MLELVDVQLLLAERRVGLGVVGEVLDLEVDALVGGLVDEDLPVGVAGADGAEHDLGVLLATGGTGLVTAAQPEEARHQDEDDEGGDPDEQRRAALLRRGDLGMGLGHGGAFRHTFAVRADVVRRHRCDPSRDR